MQNANTQVITKHNFTWAPSDYGTGPLSVGRIAAALDSWRILDMEYTHALTFGVDLAMRYTRERDPKAFKLICAKHGISLDSYNNDVKVAMCKPSDSSTQSAGDTTVTAVTQPKVVQTGFAETVSLKQPMMVIQATNKLTGEVKTAPSTRLMAAEIGGDHSAIVRCLSGKRDQAKGWTFKLIQVTT